MKSIIGQLFKCGAFALAALGLSVNSALAAYVTINNDTWKTASDGSVIYAQGAWMAKFGSTYYLYGEDYDTAVPYHDSGTVNSTAGFVCTNVYTSTDLATWSPAKKAVVQQTNIATSDYMGRVCGVVKNSAGTYVMWVKYTGTAGKGVACLTSSSPTGPFVWDHLQTVVTNVYNVGYPGDGTLFIDTAHGGTPYFICADGHGRQHAYVCPLSSDCKTINAATQIGVWPQGQEAPNVFYSTATGRYNYIMSETNGYSYSFAYQVNSTSLTSGYSADAVFSGTNTNNTYWSQVTYCIPVVGTTKTTYMMMCDRWANFNSNYKNAGHGTGFNVWCAVGASTATPVFYPSPIWRINAATGNWLDGQ